MMKSAALLVTVSLLSLGSLLSGCGLTPTEGEEALEKSLSEVVEKDDAVRNAALHVDSELLQLDQTWGMGVANAGAGDDMTASSPYLSASVGKLFTSATIMVLADEGALALDDDITRWLDPELIAGLPVTGGDAALDEITLRRLMGHRSGLPDYFSGETRGGAPTVLELMTDEPGRSWTPESLLQYTKDHFAAVGGPGEVFEYADTNYDLLGLVIEAATGEAFHEVVRAKILDPLALNSTWYHQHEAPPEGLASYADVWLEDHNAAGTAALSLDWAGGGLATTSDDLARFLRSLSEGEPVSLERFQEVWSADAVTEGVDYGYGLWRVRPAELSIFLRGFPDMLGVSGATGSYAYYIPEYDAVVTGTFDQLLYEEEHIVFLVSEVLPVLERVRVED